MTSSKRLPVSRSPRSVPRTGSTSEALGDAGGAARTASAAHGLRASTPNDEAERHAATGGGGRVTNTRARTAVATVAVTRASAVVVRQAGTGSATVVDGGTGT